MEYILILNYLSGILMLIGIPLYVLTMFGIALYRYVVIRKRAKQEPGSVDAGEVKSRLILLVIASVMLAMLLTFVGFLIWLASAPIAFM